MNLQKQANGFLFWLVSGTKLPTPRCNYYIDNDTGMPE